MERHVVYLGISGVLHPSRSLYNLVLSREPEDDGHAQYESAPILEAALAPWPHVRIILTSTVPQKHGLLHALEGIGPSLASRVDGYTFDDLTNKVIRGPKRRPFSPEDYWRLNKSEIVRAHVKWLQPNAWLALDDESILWTSEELTHNLVYVDGTLGLRDARAQAELLKKLRCKFGSGL